jgi:hypothetical protein
MQQPSGIGAFQFVVLASLRAEQLIRGCLPRVDGGHKAIVIAQLEVSQGKVKETPALARADVAVGAAAAVETTPPPAVAVEVA